MSSELVMDSGISGKTKAMILGGVVVVFALTIGILMRPGKPEAKAKPVAAQSAQAVPAAPAAPIATQATPDTQLATNRTAMQAEVPADATSQDATTAAASAAPPQSDPQIAAYAPPSAAVGASTGSQDASGWSQASIDDSNIDAPDQQVAVQTPVSKPRPAVRPPPPPAIDALHQWWRNPAKQQGFDVQYVGQAASEQALVFRFSKSVAGTDAAAKYIHVVDDKGAATNGAWVVGTNSYVLVYQGVAAGRYVVHIDSALHSANGSALGASLQGPIYIQ